MRCNANNGLKAVFFRSAGWDNHRASTCCAVSFFFGVAVARPDPERCEIMDDATPKDGRRTAKVGA